MPALMHMQPIFRRNMTNPQQLIKHAKYSGVADEEKVWRGKEQAMRKRLILLIAAVLLLVVVAAQAQLLTATSSLKVTFTPVLIQEIVEEGHKEAGVMVSPTITFKLAYKVSTD